MESLDSTQPFVVADLICENCKAAISPEKKFCSHCSYPANGTEEERRIFRLDVAKNKRMLADAQEKIASAKKWIYVTAGVFFVSGFIIYMIQDDFATLIVSLIVCLSYLILAAWCSKNPLGAILTAFLIYVTIQVVNAFADPSTIISGALLKILLIGAFIKGIRSAYEARTLMNELEKVKAEV